MRAIIILLLLQQSAFSQASNFVFKVRAWIDGTSRLVVNSNSVVWDHLAFHQPGRSDGHNDPTYLDGFPWTPQWSGSVDEVGVSCTPLPVITDFKTNIVTLNAIQARYSVQIIQQPTNGQPLIVEFDDGSPAGADWYEIELGGLVVEFGTPLSIRVASVALSWFAKTNRVYQLQYKTNVQADWIDLGAPTQGMGTNALVTDSLLEIPTKVYRVIILP